MKIFQENIKDGISLEGHGTLEVNDRGSLYIDFICTRSNIRPDFRESIPNDTLDTNALLILNAETITGIKITSKNIIIKPQLFNSMQPEPTYYRIPLDEIISTTEDKSSYQNQSMIIECHENLLIPSNKSNSIVSTLGNESHSWNETELNIAENKINIIKHDNYSEIIIRGESFEEQEYLESILLYLKITSGNNLQPYYISVHKENIINEKVISIDLNNLNKSIPSPIPENAADVKGYRLDNYHYDLLENIIKIKQSSEHYFTTIASHWHNIWSAFHVKNLYIPNLVLSLSIEGILNDIFIPVLEKVTMDSEFEKIKKEINCKISKIDGIEEKYIKNINDYVNRWGNIHPKKALEILQEKDLIEKKQKEIWEILRNKSAHPRNSDNLKTIRKKDYERLVVCLGLFYVLILNVFKFEGAQFSFAKIKDEKIVLNPYINILYNNSI